MRMNMSMPASNHSTSDGMYGMPGMLNIFSSSTNVTLYFSDWTTNTPAKYFGTLIFIFLITLLNRFLGAWRSQLGQLWAEKSATARREQLRSRRLKKRQKRRQKQDHFRCHSRATSAPQGNECHSQMETWEKERQPLSPHPNKNLGIDLSDSDLSIAETAVEQHATISIAPHWTRFFGGRWRAGNPWRLTIDAPRAVLEVVRAFIGYLLMLAVMTFNIGYLIAVLLGILVGELCLGRFTSGTGWEEGGCHD